MIITKKERPLREQIRLKSIHLNHLKVAFQDSPTPTLRRDIEEVSQNMKELWLRYEN